MSHKLEFADLRRERFSDGVPLGLARARLMRSGGMSCHSCGRPSRRAIAGLPCCDDATCGLMAENKRDFARMKRA
jgi:hypothetical protein